jgi:opacity protein-like surface antigen
MKKITILVWVALLLASSQAAAQPNPFEDYESTRPLATAEASPEQAAAPAPITPLLDRGRLVLGGSGLLSYTNSSNDVSGGANRDNSTLFTRLTPSVGYFVMDRLEVSVTPGLMLRRLDRGSADASAELSWLMEVGARYHYPIFKRLSVYGGVGLGGYFGSSERTLRAEVDGSQQTLQESTDTLGLATTLNLGGGYMVARRVQLRLGLDMTWLVGQETAPSLEDDLSVSTFHLGLAAGVFYTF